MNYAKRGKLWIAKAIDAEEPKPTEIVGSSGLQQYGGMITEEWHHKLRGQQGVKIYREMSDNDAVVGAFLYAMESLIRAVSMKIEAQNDSSESAKQAEFAESCRHDMSCSWNDVISESLTMLPFGWAYQELVYKIRRGESEDPRMRSDYNDGKIGWRKISLRSQDSLDRWCFQADGGLVGMVQQTFPAFKPTLIPIEKALLFRTRSHKNNPEGYSILRRAFRSWYIKKRLEEIEAIGMERDLTGLPVMQVPPEILASSADAGMVAIRNELLGLVQSIRRDEREGVLVPSETDRAGNPTGFKLSLLTSGGTRAIPIGDAIKRYEARMAMSVLAEVIFLGIDGGGNRALGESKIDLFLMALNSFLDTIVEVFNRFAIPRLMKLNGAPRDAWPKLVHAGIDGNDAGDLADIITKLSSVGALDMDDQLKRYLREESGLPTPEVNEETAAELPQGTVSQSTALNGAQVSGLLEIVEKVTMKLIPRESAVQLIVAAFPFSTAQAERIIGTAGTDQFEPATAEVIGQEFGQFAAPGEPEVE